MNLKNLFENRAQEIALFESMLDSNVAEFMAIYGRRRVGKTFLVKEFFTTKPVIFFKITGAQKFEILL